MPSIPSAPKIPFLAALCLLAIAACDWKLENRDLNALAMAPQMGPDCASCHAYAGIDDNHDFHLSLFTYRTGDRSPITCMDCHFTAMAHQEVQLLDTVFQDSSGGTFSSLDYPDSPDIRVFPIARIDTLYQQRPIPSPLRPGSALPYLEYITALAHSNNRMDVAFSARPAHSSRSGSEAEYHYQEQTCSAVACHGRRNEYRWRSESADPAF